MLFLEGIMVIIMVFRILLWRHNCLSFVVKYLILINTIKNKTKWHLMRFILRLNRIGQWKLTEKTSMAKKARVIISVHCDVTETSP